MRFSFATTVFGLVTLTQAVDHAVVVGGPGGIIAYNPPSVVRILSYSPTSSNNAFPVCSNRRHCYLYLPAKKSHHHSVQLRQPLYTP